MTVIGRQRVRINWRGDDLKRDMREAALMAVDRTLTACVARARDDHAYLNRSGHMEMSVQVFNFATISGPWRVSGKWGAHADYALFLEIGTSRPWSGAPRAEARAAAADGNMWAITPPQPPGKHTDTRWVRSGVPQKGLGGFIPPGSTWRRIPGEGPLMEPRMSLRPAAEIEYRLLGVRLRQAYLGEEMV